METHNEDCRELLPTSNSHIVKLNGTFYDLERLVNHLRKTADFKCPKSGKTIDSRQLKDLSNEYMKKIKNPCDLEEELPYLKKLKETFKTFEKHDDDAIQVHSSFFADAVR